MATRRFAWVLNLDADLELGTPSGYAPRRTIKEALAVHVPALARSLLGPDDLLVDETTAPMGARGLVGRAFCPTPRALAVLRRAGAEPEPAPPVAVLRRVNSRAFASALGPTLPGAAFVTTLEEAEALLASSPPVGHGWRVKRAFGMSGHNQRVVAARVSDADRAFVRGGLAQGGAQIEPNVSIVREYGLHGLLAADGTCRLGRVVRQRCDARGAWLSTELLALPAKGGGEATSSETLDAAEATLAAALGAEATRVADALAAAGYFGPFGVDAYAYRALGGSLAIQPRSEINARYSMGFAIGLPSGLR